MIEHFDLLIIGAGPAGMAAAHAALDSGARIGLVDDNPATGGQIWRDGVNARLPRAALDYRHALLAAPNVSVFSSTRVVALDGPRQMLLEGPQCSGRVSYEKLIVCSGARELLLPFPGWTLPGVTGAGGLQALLKGGLPIQGERLVIAGSGPLLLASAASARKAGAQVLRIAEQASLAALARFGAGLVGWPSKALQAAQLFDRHYRASSHVVAALGDGRVEAVRLWQAGKLVDIPCDRLACGFGLVANTGLAQALGCALRDQAIAVDHWQACSQPGVFAAGECTGVGGSELARIEGAIAGFAAVDDHTQARDLWAQRQHWQGFAQRVQQTFVLDARLKTLAEPDTLVCRCEDVPFSAVAGQSGWTAAKLVSRCGMGACQGKVCGAATRFLFGWEEPTPRPPFSPTRIDTLMKMGYPASREEP